MERWTAQHNAFFFFLKNVIERFFKNAESVTTTQRKFPLQFNGAIPTCNTILLLVQNYRETGSALKRKRKAVQRQPHPLKTLKLSMLQWKKCHYSHCKLQSKLSKRDKDFYEKNERISNYILAQKKDVLLILQKNIRKFKSHCIRIGSTPSTRANCCKIHKLSFHGQAAANNPHNKLAHAISYDVRIHWYTRP
ncbi:hypothetical protein J437_LFUL001830 [Ladona fulva]|uniref:DUF4817 domain-containing protein n=1 Tax=Ladona fulva TaxID=123851 RepID=A0A8K0NW44_LADFU|nr:hypothetical protein J437_LFUL001830 [Ladona fulva]